MRAPAGVCRREERTARGRGQGGAGWRAAPAPARRVRVPAGHRGELLLEGDEAGMEGFVPVGTGGGDGRHWRVLVWRLRGVYAGCGGRGEVVGQRLRVRNI